MSNAYNSPSAKIKSITPKLFIQDAGTDYDDGEEFNGLWPGYGNLGHWKLTEKKGSIGFNNHNRGFRDLFVRGTRWGTDSQGSFVEYYLPGSDKLISPSQNFYMMMGTGESYNEQTQFKSFLTSPGIQGHDPNYFFDIWLRLGKLPQNGDSNRQVIFYIHRIDYSRATNRYLEFGIGKDDTDFYVYFAYPHKDTHDQTILKSYELGQVLIGGEINHLGFIMQMGTREAFLKTSEGLVFKAKKPLKTISVENFSIEDTLDTSKLIEPKNSREATQVKKFSFYLNRKLYSPDQGDIEDLKIAPVSHNVNPFLGCMISSPKPVFSQDKQDINQEVKFSNHFLGRIYQVQWSTTGRRVDSRRLASVNNQKFDIPRGPQWVDFSDEFEYRGKNMLESLGRISQNIENQEGNFYVTLNSLKVKNE